MKTKIQPLPISEREYLNRHEAIAYVAKSESFFKRKTSKYHIYPSPITKQYKKTELDKLISGEIIKEQVA
jgi:hypothetical protein